MSNKTIVILTSIWYASLAISCSNENKRDNVANIKIDTILTILNTKYYESSAVFGNDTLRIKMFLPPDELGTPNKPELIREMAIIHLEPYLKEVRTIQFWTGLKDNQKYYQIGYFDSTAISKILSINSDSLLQDFKNYLVDSIRGEEIVNYNSIIKAIYSDMKLEGEVPDFMNVVYRYSQECQNKNIGDSINYHVLLQLIMETSQEMAAQRVLWKNGYDPKNIKYFLHNCINPA